MYDLVAMKYPTMMWRVYQQQQCRYASPMAKLLKNVMISLTLSLQPSRLIPTIEWQWSFHQRTPGVYVAVLLIARFMGPILGPSGADRTQVGPMLAPKCSLSGALWSFLLLSVRSDKWFGRNKLVLRTVGYTHVGLLKIYFKCRWNDRLDNSVLCNTLEHLDIIGNINHYKRKNNSMVLNATKKQQKKPPKRCLTVEFKMSSIYPCRKCKNHCAEICCSVMIVLCFVHGSNAIVCKFM